MHGPTYTGHALGCAAANASLDLFAQEDRMGQVAGIEARLKAGLEPLRGAPGVADVRVLGSVGAVELAAAFDVNALRAWFVEEGVFIRPLGRVIYLAPAYTIGAEDLGRLIDGIKNAVGALLI
jgi:adenosylmethionine---8-amino-7-oxononanoate aminotransferase